MKLMVQALAAGDIVRFRGRDCEILGKVVNGSQTRLWMSFVDFNGMTTWDKVWFGSHFEITIIKTKGAVPWED